MVMGTGNRDRNRGGDREGRQGKDMASRKGSGFGV